MLHKATALTLPRLHYCTRLHIFMSEWIFVVVIVAFCFLFSLSFVFVALAIRHRFAFYCYYTLKSLPRSPPGPWDLLFLFFRFALCQFALFRLLDLSFWFLHGFRGPICTRSLFLLFLLIYTDSTTDCETALIQYKAKPIQSIQTA